MLEYNLDDTHQAQYQFQCATLECIFDDTYQMEYQFNVSCWNIFLMTPIRQNTLYSMSNVGMYLLMAPTRPNTSSNVPCWNVFLMIPIRWNTGSNVLRWNFFMTPIRRNTYSNVPHWIFVSGSDFVITIYR